MLWRKVYWGALTRLQNCTAELFLVTIIRSQNIEFNRDEFVMKSLNPSLLPFTLPLALSHFTFDYVSLNI